MDIDTASMDLAKSFGGLPPKLKYRFRRFMQHLVHSSGPDSKAGPERVEKMAAEMVKMINEELHGSPLAKNEARFSTYENGSVRLDFGSDVPDNVKKAAISWAKNRGLTAIEASMAKSMNAPEYVIMSLNNSTRPDTLSTVISKEF